MLYHVPTQPAGLVLVGINFALGFALLDDVVLTDLPLFLRAAEELSEAPNAAEFASVLELPLACGRLLSFFHVRSKDPKDFRNSLAGSLANLLLIWTSYAQFPKPHPTHP